MKDYVSEKGLSKEEDNAYFTFFVGCDPTCYDEVVKIGKWRKDMDVEIEAIHINDTYELKNLPEGGKTIGVKWIYKTKLREK